MTKDELLALLREECVVAGGQAAWARSHEMSAVYVSDVLAGRRAPAGKILAALGLEQVISYRRVGSDD